MKRLSATILAFGIALSSASLAADRVVQTWRGTIMCGTPRAWAEVCPKNAHYVFVSGTTAYDIKVQKFSGFRDLVGQPLSITAEVSGKTIDILQLMKVPVEPCDDDY